MKKYLFMIFLPHNVRMPDSAEGTQVQTQLLKYQSFDNLFPHITTVHSAVNEYPGTDNCGNVNEKSSHSNCSIAECFPEKFKRCWNEKVSQGVNC